MIYPSGEKIEVGDVVEMWPDNSGIVVCIFGDSEFAEGYPREEWEYLKSGVLIDSQQAGLIHFEESEPSFKLIRRASDKG